MPRSCGSVQNYFRQVDFFPDLRRNQAVLEGMTRAAARQGAQVEPRLPAEIPVVVHVVYRTDDDNLSDAQIASQIDVLNEDYAAANKDLEGVPSVFTDVIGKPGLRFALATTDPSGAPTDGITRRRTTVASFGVDDKVKAQATGGTDAWDTARYLNIWVCRIDGGVLGYAQFPGGPPATDGVVIMTTAFGRGGSAKAPFDLGRTAVHEVGHYLNLSHIWGEARVPTCTDTDSVDDTPNQWGPNFNKPTFPSASCGNTPDGDMFMNYMDYVDDDTMVMFTDEQVARMHAALEFSRPELGQSGDAPPARRAPSTKRTTPRQR
jgi:Pregnancy-associated plasma protein-A